MKLKNRKDMRDLEELKKYLLPSVDDATMGYGNFGEKIAAAKTRRELLQIIKDCLPVIYKAGIVSKKFFEREFEEGELAYAGIYIYGWHEVRDRKVFALDKAKVWACGNSEVCANDDTEVFVHDYSDVWAYNNSKVWACDDSQVWAYNNSKVWAYDNSAVWAYDGSAVETFDKVRLCDLRELDLRELYTERNIGEKTLRKIMLWVHALLVKRGSEMPTKRWRLYVLGRKIDITITITRQED